MTSPRAVVSLPIPIEQVCLGANLSMPRAFFLYDLVSAAKTINLHLSYQL